MNPIISIFTVILLIITSATASKQVETVSNSRLIPRNYSIHPISICNGEVFFTTPTSLTGMWEVSILDHNKIEISHQEFYADGGDTYFWDIKNKIEETVTSENYIAILRFTVADGSVVSMNYPVGVHQ